MIFDYIELLYVLVLVLIHDLMLALKHLCEQHIISYHTNCIQAYCIFQFLFFQLKMEDHYED